MIRRAVAALLAVLALVVLPGCRVDTTIDLDVHADGSGVLTLTAVADRAVVDNAPGLANDLRLADAQRAGWVVEGPASTTDGGLRVVLTHPFATVKDATTLLQYINGPNGPLHGLSLTRSVASGRATFQLTGALRIDGDLVAFADTTLVNSLGKTPWADKLSPAERAGAVSATFTVKLPGAVTSAARRDGDRLTWTVPNGGDALQVASSAVVGAGGAAGGDGGGGGFWRVLSWLFLLLLVGWLALVGAITAQVVRVRRRRAQRRAVLMAHRARNL